MLGRLAQAEATAHARYGRTGETARFGPLVAVHAGPDLPVNTAWHDGTRPPDPTELQAFEAFSTRHRQAATVQVLSASAPALLPLLKDRGYTVDLALHVYAHDLTDRVATAPSDIREETVDVWATVAAQCFGPGAGPIMSVVAHAPGTRRFVAWLDGRPAATTAMSTVQGVAAFHGTATRAEMRGRGLQTALLAHRLHAAARAGADLASVFVTPGSGSERNVERAGFRMVGARLTLTRHS
jgi:GNAT superfamily N-acetyltransferase